MKYGIMLLLAVFSFAGRAEAQQQRSYAQTQLNSLRVNNSAANFTSKQELARVVQGSVPRFNFSGVNRNVFGQTQKQKPFANANQGPSTSPYMGLLADTPYSSTTSNYFSKVRPQIEQQKMNDKLMSQNMRLQQQLQAAAAQGPYDPTGSENRAPTGHSAVYMNNGGVYGNPGGYYPQVPIRSVRGAR